MNLTISSSTIATSAALKDSTAFNYHSVFTERERANTSSGATEITACEDQ